jgi:hypothetical protein
VRFPRDLTARERGLLALLLPSGGFLEADTYRAQLDATSVVGRCRCGCATINLVVDAGAARATTDHSPLLPFEARGKDPTDPSLPIEVILFARAGALESLEIVYYGDRPPAAFPDMLQLEVVKAR